MDKRARRPLVEPLFRRRLLFQRVVGTNSKNSRGVTMLTAPTFFKVSKSRSPVTKSEQPESSAAARIRLSSASRQRLTVETTRAVSVCRSTKKAIKRACRGEKPNFVGSFWPISSRTSSDATNLHERRAARHACRQKPSVVKMASQTLLSSSTRTRQGENVLFRQAVFARQAVKSRQGAVQFAVRGKKILINPLGLLVGQPLDFFDDLRCVHVSNVGDCKQKQSGKSVLCVQQAGAVHRPEERPLAYPWGSFGHYLSVPEHRPHRVQQLARTKGRLGEHHARELRRLDVP